ncbi:MAG: Holliday junction branch migration protein RuvA [Lachnospiraceae bacterium]|nr:Holliday junction branch migration protein RuvA [Lachnospiraceae bacterium]
MIGYIKGVIKEIEEASIILEDNGIGFRIYMPKALLSQEVYREDQVKIYTYLHIKEDSIQLYGFFTKDDLNIFRLLLNVNGIGPKAAMGILSVLSADDLRFAVLSNDVVFISKAPGIGEKTAQKLILELKDKFQMKDAFDKKLSHVQEKEVADKRDSGVKEEVVQALVALGYSRTKALQAVKKVEGAEQMDAEEILKAALQLIF